MFKTLLNGFIDHPLLASIFVTDLLILAFHKPPFIFSLLMLALLSGISMYLGQKLMLFKR
jgi:hypothetical protein